MSRLKPPVPRFACTTADTPIVLHVGGDVAPRTVSDREAMRLLAELAAALAVRLAAPPDVGRTGNG